jgi:hypothetical protein
MNSYRVELNNRMKALKIDCNILQCEFNIIEAKQNKLLTLLNDENKKFRSIRRIDELLINNQVSN